MAKVLDKWMLKGEPDTAEQDNSRKAYNNMMVYLKELKNHNVQSVELAQQIFLLSENSVEKLNEMRKMILENGDNDTEKLLELLGQTEKLQLKMNEVAELQNGIQNIDAKLNEVTALQNSIQSIDARLNEVSKSQEIVQNMEGRVVKTIREATAGQLSAAAHEQIVQTIIDKSQTMITESMDTSARGVKREISSMNDSLEESIQSQVAELEENMGRMKKTMTIYMRILTWAMAVVIILLALMLLPNFIG